MSILTEILLLCDSDGGADCTFEQPFNQDGAKDAKLVTPGLLRINARQAGWVKVGRKDYCESCAKRLGF